MAVISQLYCTGSLEHIGKKCVPSREGQDQVDLVVRYKLIDRVQEVEEPDEIKLGFVSRQACLQFESFLVVFICYLDIVFVIHVYDVQPGFEQVQDRLYRMNGD